MSVQLTVNDGRYETSSTGSRVGNADIESEPFRVIPDVGRIVAGRTGTQYVFGAKRVGREKVKTVDTMNRELPRIEDGFAAGDGSPIRIAVILPCAIKRENVGIEAGGERREAAFPARNRRRRKNKIHPSRKRSHAVRNLYRQNRR